MLSVGENQTGGDIFLSFSSPVEHRLLFPRQQKRRGKLSRVVVLKMFISFFHSYYLCMCERKRKRTLIPALDAFRNILFIILINTNPHVTVSDQNEISHLGQLFAYFG